MGDKIYGMSNAQLRIMLSAASKYIAKGIYAVKKNGIVELKKEIFNSNEELKYAVREYARKGLKVYYNVRSE